MPISFRSCDLMLFGRELVRVTRADGSEGYEASAETNRRADEAGMFWRSLPSGVIDRIISTGGYPQLAKDMEQPRDGTNEGSLMAERLKEKWGVTGRILVEPGARHTFENFSNSLNKRYLEAGSYNPDHPLGLVVNEAQAKRVILLARYALNIGRESLFRLQPLVPEQDPEVIRKEKLLTKLTEIVIRQATTDAPPGSPHCIEHAFEKMINVWNEQETLLPQFDRKYGQNWTPQDVPVIDFPRIAPVR